jgi:hypothetical protein
VAALELGTKGYGNSNNNLAYDVVDIALRIIQIWVIAIQGANKIGLK